MCFHTSHSSHIHTYLRQRLAEFLKDTYGAVSNEVLERSDKAAKQALEEVGERRGGARGVL